MAAETLHLRIKGRVQGVGFRYWVRRNAEQLHLTGWVRNRRDGTVEAIFAGEKPVVDEMRAICAWYKKRFGADRVLATKEEYARG